MSESYVPPTGPPPPKVPEGWKAIWNTQYSEYFYVNIYTKKSQWDKPTEPVYPPGEAPLDSHPPPPTYDNPNNMAALGDKKAGVANDISEDEKLARQLQAEEDARAGLGPSGPGGPGGNKGSADGYYNQGPVPPGYDRPAPPPPGGYSGYGSPPPPGQYGAGYGGGPPPPGGQPGYPDPTLGQQDQSQKGKGKHGGLLGKLLGKASGGSSHGGQQYYPNSQYGGAPGRLPFGGAAGPFGHGAMGGSHGGKKPGMGAGGAAALGAGGGLVGGMLLADAMHDGGDHGGGWGGDDGGYGGDDGGGFGGDDGGGFGGDDGGGFGGDDGGGGDFGGDFGGD